MRTATSYFVTDVRRAGVSPAGIAFSVWSRRRVVVFCLEGEARVLGLGAIDQNNLPRRDSLPYLALELILPFHSSAVPGEAQL
jgi:hypothetical protein